jgi:hypothetical protein
MKSHTQKPHNRKQNSNYTHTSLHIVRLAMERGAKSNDNEKSQGGTSVLGGHTAHFFLINILLLAT